MSETDNGESERTIEEIEEAHNDEEQTITGEEQNRLFDEKPKYSPFTVSLKADDTVKEYALNTETRRSIQERAKHEYEGNPQFSCWWKVATEEDEEDPDTIHEEGDPILVIETVGPMVPWENLDQLELEMQDTSAFDGFESGGSDVDEGGGMRTVKPDDEPDETEEKSRTHFGVTPQDFEEVPSPDGEDPDKVPAKPKTFDDPQMVVWVPDNPEIEHKWSAGEAITSMDSWVEWNVQQKANQPRITKDKDHSNDHWRSILEMHDCSVIGEMAPSQSTPDTSDGPSGSVERKGEKSFEDGKYGGNNWNV